MLHIHHAEDDSRSPSKIYADACWAANPRLSPTWWSEALGHTVGKLALDWRTRVHQPHYLATGCNLVLASPQTWPQTCTELAAAPAPQSFVTILVTPHPGVPNALPSPHFLVWQPQSGPDASQSELQALEGLVKSGEIEAYGLQLADSIAHPLHLWLDAAAEAANTVYGRRKRPALRLLMAGLDLLDLTLLTAPVTQHKTESVSTLELAARLALPVIITTSLLPDEAAATPPAAALQVLTDVAQAENALNQALGGWPQQNGQQLFSVLAHLAQGQAPWPTPALWHAWQAHLWPQLQTQWNTLANPASRSLISHYLLTLGAVQPYGEVLAVAAAQPLLLHFLAGIASRLPQSWQGADSLALATGLLASMPGVTSLALATSFNPAPLQQLGTLPDLGKLLLQPAA